MKAKKSLRVASSRAEIVEIICEEIRSRRVSVAWLSEQSGVYQATIYFWLDGTTYAPRISTLVAVAEALGFDIVLQRKTGRRLRAVS